MRALGGRRKLLARFGDGSQVARPQQPRRLTAQRKVVVPSDGTLPMAYDPTNGMLPQSWQKWNGAGWLDACDPRLFGARIR